MKIYLAGPMQGKPGLNRATFTSAAKWLREQGHEVFNPSEADERERRSQSIVEYNLQQDDHRKSEIEKGTARAKRATEVKLIREYMKRDLPILLAQEAIALLPGWECSKGAACEHEVASRMGLRVLTLKRPPVGMLRGRNWVLQGEDGVPVPVVVEEEHPEYSCKCVNRGLDLGLKAGEVCTCGQTWCDAFHKPEYASLHGIAWIHCPACRRQRGIQVATEVKPADGDEPKRFASGAQRDSKKGKGRYDLLCPYVLSQLAGVMEEGVRPHADRADRNWELGMPLGQYLDSAIRHLLQEMDGLIDEDHAGHALWNVHAYIHTAERIKRGDLPAELDDLPRRQLMGKAEGNADFPSHTGKQSLPDRVRDR